MPKALTNEQFQEDLPVHLILFSDYIGVEKEVEIKCLKCNQVFKQKAERVRINKKCPLCESIVSHRLTEEKVKERILLFPKIKFISYDITKMEVITQCLTCGDIETNHPLRFKDKKNKLGCKQCNKKQKDKNLKGKSVNIGNKNGMFKYKKVNIPCANCGKILIRPESDLEKNRVFCNTKCKSEWQSKSKESLQQLKHSSELGAKATKKLFKDPAYRKAWSHKMKYEVKRDPTKTKSYYSKISIKFFNEIIEALNLTLEDVYYKDNEFFVRDLPNDKIFFYDFKIKHTNKLIEFNGDIFHANPELFTEKDTPNPFDRSQTAEDIWSNDKIKRDLANSQGFEILYIWENDYKKTPQKSIKQTLQYLGG